MAITKLVVVHGGELAKDIAEQIVQKKPQACTSALLDVSVRCASERPKSLADLGADTAVCFVLQTIENASPTEEVRMRMSALEAGLFSFVFPLTKLRPTVLHRSLQSSIRADPASVSSNASRTPKHC